MEWHRLLSSDRLRRPDAVPQKGRSPFQQDIDRITFSAAFRGLAHKTQVHPLSPNDHVHTRLTHSIEVASVGRSLGTAVGTEIAERLNDPKISADIFGYVVQAACLAHDIGNPPFGHSGEYAIRSWFNRAESNRAPFAKKLPDPVLTISENSKAMPKVSESSPSSKITNGLAASS
jgi:dGTPase